MSSIEEKTSFGTNECYARKGSWDGNKSCINRKILERSDVPVSSVQLKKRNACHPVVLNLLNAQRTVSYFEINRLVFS
jgi:hypothetical protein